MRNNREAQRDALKQRLIDAAEAQIAVGGLSGLKARDVTAAAGCALGALYTAFEDLDRLILQVNSRTLARLGAALQDSVAAVQGPRAVMAALAQGYVSFAQNNFRLWAALFTHRLPEGIDAPEWHRAEHAVLIAQIIAPLSQLRPDLTGEALRQRAGTVFAAVHGVVMLALTARFVGTPVAQLPGEVAALVEAMMRGLEQ
ncbi:TetR family transcriptional regulator [Cypionkella aquatica]|uniref:TetR family transcriptional regulator n=1 Tax=Cypionkella aquatica TaxID=1756042 RepID=A0AA37WZW2_9RHOB|nr:TetR-like C-terminal domain-containing protein [Cypionkella aquatica]GLS87093.1 TetR family transcriptional regulator [Cypionkella aquatica]